MSRLEEDINRRRVLDEMLGEYNGLDKLYIRHPYLFRIVNRNRGRPMKKVLFDKRNVAITLSDILRIQWTRWSLLSRAALAMVIRRRIFAMDAKIWA